MSTEAALKAWETRRANGTAGATASKGGSLATIAAKRSKEVLLQMVVSVTEAKASLSFTFTNATGQPCPAPEGEQAIPFLSVQSLLVPTDTGLAWHGHGEVRAAFTAPASAVEMLQALAAVKGLDQFLAAAMSEAEDSTLEYAASILANHVRATSVRFQIGETDKTVNRGAAYITGHKLLSAYVEHVTESLQANAPA